MNSFANISSFCTARYTFTLGTPLQSTLAVWNLLHSGHIWAMKLRCGQFTLLWLNEWQVQHWGLNFGLFLLFAPCATAVAAVFPCGGNPTPRPVPLVNIRLGFSEQMRLKLGACLLYFQAYENFLWVSFLETIGLPPMQFHGLSKLGGPRRTFLFGLEGHWTMFLQHGIG